jgi:hypothetical protein
MRFFKIEAPQLPVYLFTQIPGQKLITDLFAHITVLFFARTE